VRAGRHVVGLLEAAGHRRTTDANRLADDCPECQTDRSGLTGPDEQKDTKRDALLRQEC
jgi:hypothetical protein